MLQKASPTLPRHVRRCSNHRIPRHRFRVHGVRARELLVAGTGVERHGNLVASRDALVGPLPSDILLLNLHHHVNFAGAAPGRAHDL